jgi:tetratricopeptide (TPR) repeat protein
MKKIFLLLIGILSIINTFGQSAQGYLERGIAKYANHDFAGAISDYTKAIELNHKLKAAVYFYRSLAKEKTGDVSGVLSDLDKSIVLDPKESQFYYNRGDVKYFKLQDKKGGCLDWSKAGELGQGDAKINIQRHCN